MFEKFAGKFTVVSLDITRPSGFIMARLGKGEFVAGIGSVSVYYNTPHSIQRERMNNGTSVTETLASGEPLEEVRQRNEHDETAGADRRVSEGAGGSVGQGYRDSDGTQPVHDSADAGAHGRQGDPWAEKAA